MISSAQGTIDEKTIVKYLRVILDQKLTLENHVVKKLRIAFVNLKCLLFHCLPTFKIRTNLLRKHFCKIFDKN